MFVKRIKRKPSQTWVFAVDSLVQIASQLSVRICQGFFELHVVATAF